MEFSPIEKIVYIEAMNKEKEEQVEYDIAKINALVKGLGGATGG